MTDKRRRLDELGADKPDPELAQLSDEALLQEAEREASGVAERERARELARRDPLCGYLVDLSDEELLAAFEAARMRRVHELRAMSDKQLGALRAADALDGVLVQAERERRRPPPPEPPAPVVVAAPEPPVEPHLVTLPEPQPAAPLETAREKWDREQHERMAALVAAELADGERKARRAHELGLAHPGERLGAGELLDLLRRDV
jgi:hypothetical protein